MFQKQLSETKKESIETYLQMLMAQYSLALPWAEIASVIFLSKDNNERRLKIFEIWLAIFATELTQ